VLTWVGIYGVLSFQVARRTNEVGIRMVLGARPYDILALFLRREMKIFVAGLATGMAGALGMTRVMAHMLFGVSSTDPFTYTAVSILLLLAGLTAIYVPARPAMKVNPVVALRYE
jgi:putative ABC transport system permease protein